MLSFVQVVALFGISTISMRADEVRAWNQILFQALIVDRL